jgi:hypothetical protein
VRFIDKQERPVDTGLEDQNQGNKNPMARFMDKHKRNGTRSGAQVILCIEVHTARQTQAMYSNLSGILSVNRYALPHE